LNKVERSNSNADHLALFSGATIYYKRIAEIAGLSRADLARSAEVKKSSVRFDEKIPITVADRLLEAGTIQNLVAGYFRGDALEVRLWFMLPNAELGNISPRDMIRIWRGQKLLNFVLEACWSEHIR
jgi:hypothetical protein